MRPWPRVLVGLLLLALAASAVMLVVLNTEWADEKVPLPEQGEARANPLYAAQALARVLGADVVRRSALEPMPPGHATLVLTASQWNFRPGSEKILRQWVEQGGHLVIRAALLDEDALSGWLPVRQAKPKTSESSDDGGKAGGEGGKSGDGASDAGNNGNASSSHDSSENNSGDGESGPPCRHLAETGASAGPGFRVCGYAGFMPLEPRPGAVSLWSVREKESAVLLRAALGQGDVTVIGLWYLMGNRQILNAEHAQIWAAALRLRPGLALWFVDQPSRAPLLVWLWQQGWVVIALGLLALVAALWRGAPRFGPRQALPVLERRSMAEQITGTAHFLARSDPRALHRAALRALDEAAAPRLPRGYASLTADARARLLAPLTGQNAGALAHAMTEGERSAAQLEADLCILETAARRLREKSMTNASANKGNTDGNT